MPYGGQVEQASTTDLSGVSDLDLMREVQRRIRNGGGVLKNAILTYAESEGAFSAPVDEEKVWVEKARMEHEALVKWQLDLTEKRESRAYGIPFSTLAEEPRYKLQRDADRRAATVDWRGMDQIPAAGGFSQNVMLKNGESVTFNVVLETQ